MTATDIFNLKRPALLVKAAKLMAEEHATQYPTELGLCPRSPKWKDILSAEAEFNEMRKKKDWKYDPALHVFHLSKVIALIKFLQNAEI